MRVKILFIVMIATFGSSCLGQNRKFLIHVNQASPYMYEEEQASGMRLDAESLNVDAICGGAVADINAKLRKKIRKPLQQDSILNMICRSGVATYSSSKYASRKTWRKEQKSIDYALKMQHSTNKMFIAYAFKVDLLDLSSKEKFYCDRRNRDSDLLLYEGDAPRIRNPEHEGYVEPIPLGLKSEEQAVAALMQHLENNGGVRDVFSKRFTQVGIAVKLEKRSLYRSRRPYMYVVVILAGKQNNYMKKKDKLERLVKADQAYE